MSLLALAVSPLGQVRTKSPKMTVDPAPCSCSREWRRELGLARIRRRDHDEPCHLLAGRFAGDQLAGARNQSAEKRRHRTCGSRYPSPTHRAASSVLQHYLGC